MNALSKEKRDRLILISIATGFALVGIWMGVAAPQKNKMAETEKIISDLEGKIAKADRLIGMRAKVEADLQDAQDLLSQIEERMPSGDLYGWAFNTLNAFRNPYNVNVVNIKREVLNDVKLIPDFPYQAAVFNVELEGFYHDIGRLIADFENAYPFVRVQNLIMEPAGEKGETLNARMDFVALIQPSNNS